MKKPILLAFSAAVLVITPALAQQPETRLEELLGRKGQIFTAQYYEVGTLTQRDGGVRMDVAKINITDLASGGSTNELGLRIQVKATSRHEDRIGFLDAQEVTSLASALPGIAAAQQIPRGEEVSREIRFIAGSFTIRVRQGEPGDPDSFLIKLGDIASAQQLFDMKEFPAFREMVNKAVSKIKSLQ